MHFFPWGKKSANPVMYNNYEIVRNGRVVNMKKRFPKNQNE